MKNFHNLANLELHVLMRFYFGNPQKIVMNLKAGPRDDQQQYRGYIYTFVAVFLRRISHSKFINQHQGSCYEILSLGYL